MTETPKQPERDTSLPTPDDYQQALFVQDGCNLSAIVHSFSRVVTRLWNEANALGKGTEFVNRHPISKLYADKIAQLARVTGVGPMLDVDAVEFQKAYDVCQERAKKQEIQQFVDEVEKEHQK